MKKFSTHSFTSVPRQQKSISISTQLYSFLDSDLIDDEKSLKILKGAIRICISKNRQHNGRKKTYKRTNNDLQNIHIKLKTLTGIQIFSDFISRDSKTF